MNIREGAGRLRRAGRWMILIPLSVGVLVLCCEAVFAHRHPMAFDFGPVLVDMIVLSIPGALLSLAGWILEGFAKEAE